MTGGYVISEIPLKASLVYDARLFLRISLFSCSNEVMKDVGNKRSSSASTSILELPSRQSKLVAVDSGGPLGGIVFDLGG